MMILVNKNAKAPSHTLANTHVRMQTYAGHTQYTFKRIGSCKTSRTHIKNTCEHRNGHRLKDLCTHGKLAPGLVLVDPL